MTFRPLRAYRKINRDLTRLRAADAVADEEARLELTRRATVFSHRSRQVVDNTMQLSAVLLRAGEVEEANRMLAEVDQKVEEERAVLIETVNEVKVEGAMRRRNMTRLRLAKLLLSAVLGAGMMMFSAFGVAVAGYLAPDPVPAGEDADGSRGLIRHEHSFDRYAVKLRKIEVAPGITLSMTESQFAVFERLRGSPANGSELEAFLRDLLPGHLAKKVAALTGSVNGAVTDVGDAVSHLPARVKKAQASAPQRTGTDAEQAERKARKQKAADKDQEGEGDGGGQNGEDDCEDDDDSDASETLGPGDCVPIVNKESPL